MLKKLKVIWEFLAILNKDIYRLTEDEGIDAIEKLMGGISLLWLTGIVILSIHYKSDPKILYGMERGVQDLFLIPLMSGFVCVGALFVICLIGFAIKSSIPYIKTTWLNAMIENNRKQQHKEEEKERRLAQLREQQKKFEF